MTTPTKLDAEVVVVGARVAGAATAMLLAAQGHDVVVVDRAVFPSDTLSTHAIARSGMVQLQRWGLLDDLLATGAPPIRDVVFHTPAGDIARTVKEHGGVDHLLAPRRHILDPLLLAAAERAGARVLTGATVDGVLLDDSGRASGVWGRRDESWMVIDARFVVGADGLRSRVARSVSAPIVETRPSGGAGFYAYYKGDWPAMEYYIGDGTFAGVFPTHDGEACIWVTAPSDWTLRHRRNTGSPNDALEAMVAEAAPPLAERLQRSVPASTAQGMMHMPNQIRRATGPGWALVGDAGYHRDAVTGHGISDAFRDAELLADALDDALRGTVDEATALAGFEHERDTRLREIFEITIELSQYPAAGRFIELQKQLGRAIETEAAHLLARRVRIGTSFGC